MCGIAGLYNTTGPVDRGILTKMSAALSHRGPDMHGELLFEDDWIGFAHQRLSIIDLSDAGSQPMVSPRTGNVICYNGEVYNFENLRRQLLLHGYSFRGNSDTEVVLAAYDKWGVDCVHRLMGMFAFAMWDTRERKLVLFRDRAGQKPLYYAWTRFGLCFASELTAILANPAIAHQLDRKAFEEYLAYGYCSGGSCLIDGVQKLPAATIAEFTEDGQSTLTRYWELPADSPETGDASELTDELEELLEQAVRRRLVSDVPLGILLSGGVDSSLLAVLASRHGTQSTYTISFPGSDLDEAPHAQVIADFVGSQHTVLPATEIKEDAIERLAGLMDEPVADPSLFPTLMVSELIRTSATVALGGDGGDELFGGYLHYPWLLKAASLTKHVPDTVLATGSKLISHLPMGFKGRTHGMGLQSPQHGLSGVNAYFDRETRSRYWPRSSADPEERREAMYDDNQGLLLSATRSDFSLYLPDDILSKVDRMSMAVSLEVRAPWLDHRVIEFAFGRVPAELKANPKQRKILPKLLADRLLPQEFDTERKQGFTPPLANWLSDRFKKTVDGVLDSANEALFPKQLITDLRTAQKQGHNNAHRIFAIVLFELWREMNGVQA